MRLIMWILLSLSLVCCSASNQQDTQLMPTTLQKTPSAESVPNDSGLGEFFAASDVGNPKVVGATEYDANSQEFSLSAGGINMWGKRDEMQFVYKQLQGDFILRAQIKFIGQGTDPHRKLGWIVRRSLNAESAQVSAVVHGDGLTSLQFRNTDSADTEQIESTESSPNVIQLERRGNIYIMSTAKLGQPFTQVSIEQPNLGDKPYIGLFLCAHNPDVRERAVFSNVRIIRPVDPNYQPYRDYIGSNLEIMDVGSGQRKVIYRSDDSIQAPNWTWDASKLIFNTKGKLFNYDLASTRVSELNTGFADNNNNDHVLSWDAKNIAISHHNAQDNNHSTIYILPLQGSEQPKQVTQYGAGHSFLHGFSPDDQTLIFTGQRDKQWNIFKVDIASGEETQLTFETNLNDGSEYAPDGDTIYFNSTRSGNMQIWRMEADGSEPRQITFDHFNNWFPHISPDGKQMIMLSYLPEVPAAEHPFYKQVYLRIVPLDFSAPPKIIAYVYGGQGTINVPSWSPDSKTVAFVSNTQL
jgi:TolB protein